MIVLLGTTECQSTLLKDKFDLGGYQQSCCRLHCTSGIGQCSSGWSRVPVCCVLFLVIFSTQRYDLPRSESRSTETLRRRVFVTGVN